MPESEFDPKELREIRKFCLDLMLREYSIEDMSCFISAITCAAMAEGYIKTGLVPEIVPLDDADEMAGVTAH